MSAAGLALASSPVAVEEPKIKTTAKPTRTQRPATLKDVAEIAGVSVSTVSYVVSGRANRKTAVPEPTRSRVLAAMEQVGYRRNRTARALRKERTELIALVWYGTMTPWIDSVSAEVEEVADRRDYGVIHLPFRDRASGRRVLNLLASGMVDGAIVLGTQQLATRDIRELATGVALVVHSETMRPHGFDVVRHDQRRAMGELVEHMLDQGCRDIRVLAQRNQVTDRGPRLTGALETLERNNVPTEPVVTGARREQMYKVAAELLRDDRPDGIIATTDRCARATIWAADQVGLAVPHDLAVAGVGNTEEGTLIPPTLTTTGDPSQDKLTSAVSLFERIEEPGSRGVVIERPWRLIVRESSTRPGGGD